MFEEITLDQASEEERRNIIGSYWVHRNKGDEVRSRIVGLGFDEVIMDADDIYASPPFFAILRVILCIALARSWSIRVGGISTAFLHESYAWSNNKHPFQTTIRFRHQQEHLLETEEGNVAPKITKAPARPPSKHHARTGYILISEPNMYKHPEGKAYTIAYVDDLPFVGDTDEINSIFSKVQEKMLLQAAGQASPGNTISFVERRITNKGDNSTLVLMTGTWTASPTR